MNGKFYFYLFLLSLMFLFPGLTFAGAKSGLLLWFNTLLPTLFPFVLMSELLKPAASKCAPLCSGLCRRLLRVHPAGSYSILIGFLCGYPMGAKAVCDLKSQDLLTANEAQLLVAVCNNPSPMYMMGYIILGCLALPGQLPQLLAITYLSPMIFGILHVRLHKWPKPTDTTVPASPLLVKPSMDNALFTSLELMAKIGGYLMLFSVLGQFIMTLPLLSNVVKASLVSIAEVTTGSHMLAGIHLKNATKIVLIMMSTCFGGLSISAQTNSLIHNQGLSLKSYIIDKLKIAVIAGSLCGGALAFGWL